jgi:phosphate uptake regulator
MTMVFGLFKGRGVDQVATIEAQVAEMLSTTRGTFRMAIDAILRRVEPAAVGEELHRDDRSVNRVEREIRRELVVHAGVRGAGTEVPLLMVYVRIAKNIERIGDLAKDIWDLAAAGVDLSASSHTDAVAADAALVASLFDDTARVFGERDEDAATAFLNQLDPLKDRFEQVTLDQLSAEGPVAEAVGTALLYRHLMRIVANLMNVMTAVVMPVDRLDYWDEDAADRE